MLRADRVDLQGVGELHLTAGDYWYEKVSFTSDNPLSLIGEGKTNIYVKHVAAMQGNNIVNKDDKPLFIYIYENNKSSLNLQGSAHIHGYIYTRGGVEMSGATQITGAVNVVDLSMKGGTITYRPINIASNPDHYRIHLNKSLGSISATACADQSCTLYKNTINKLEIVDTVNNTEIANFSTFNEGTTAKQNIGSKKKNCMAFTIKDTAGKSGADPWPSAQPPLRCFIDGLESSCRVCNESTDLAAYVYGKLTIKAEDAGTMIGSELTIDAISGQGALTNSDGNILKKNMAISLPLVVSYDKAELLTLSIKETVNNQLPVYHKINIAFVPKALRWVNSSANCVTEDNIFIYKELYETCRVLGKAGDNAKLTLQALGEGDIPIEQYQAKEQELIAINELDGKIKSIDEKIYTLDLDGKQQNIIHKIKNVALIRANVKSHCAIYAPKNKNNECSLITEGDLALLGRTVPDRLLIEGIAGDIKNNFVYRGQKVEFNKRPQFSVKGCGFEQADRQCNLPSYSGEFAQGLARAANLNFTVKPGLISETISLENEQGGQVNFDQSLVDGKERTQPGTHLIKPNDALALIFAKEAPMPIHTIDQKLQLTINVAQDQVVSGLAPSGRGLAALDADDAELRYGFLTLYDLELATNTAGVMPAVLNYYGVNIQTLQQDELTNLGINEGSAPVKVIPNQGEPDISGILLTNREVQIPAQANEWQGDIKLVTPLWLKTYDAQSCSAEDCLVDASGHLTIKEQAQKRGYDRIFNRREAVR